ncbi:MAG TPA: FG-GAP-like repeat-containing protein [Candidatus Deferrimicrobiaceae bacterium]|nr:FG-GAP-like repeat-containing protein [Candidatus Deferrimicrobiaceae bacterium]
MSFASIAAAQQNPFFLTASVYSSGGYQASAVVVGDVNRDGRPDLVIANQCNSGCVNGTVSILLGNGDGTFQPAVAYNSGGSRALSVAVVDVNDDGKPDVVVANSCASSSCPNGSVSILLGNGDGTFQTAVAYNSGGQNSASVAVADVNGDGKLDLLVANSCASSSNCTNGSVSVLLGNGDGTFRPAAAYSVSGEYSNSVSAADVNGDGKLDLLVSNLCGSSAYNCPSGGTVSVLLGNGDGTFQPAANYGVGPYVAYSLAVGDVNGDGNPDLAVAGQCPGSTNCAEGVISILLGNGDGTFQSAVSYNSGDGYPTSIAIGDINGDGKLDLAVADQCATGNCPNGAVTLLLGNGDGTFQAATGYSPGEQYAAAVAMGDVNEDGKLDLLVLSSCSSCSSDSVSVLLGYGNGALAAARTYGSGGYNAQAVAVGDVNGDGQPDLVVANQCAVINCSGGTLGVLLGNSDGTFRPAVAYNSGGFQPYAIVVQDVNGDGKADLVVANACASGACGNGSVGILLGNGDGTFQPALVYGSGAPSALSIVVADVNGDGKPDVVVGNLCVNSSDCSTSTFGVLLGNGDGTFQPATTFATGGQSTYSIAVADVNGDGKPDLLGASICAASNCTDGAASVLLGNGDGTFQAPIMYDTGGEYATYLAVADINKDGKLDLLVANSCASTSNCAQGSIAVLPGNGDGTFRPPLSSLTSSVSVTALALADFNGDGKLDIASGSANTIMLGNGDGTFQTGITLGATGPDIAVGDFNQDGKPDLAVGGVRVLLNIASNFEYATTTAIASSANPVLGRVTFTATVTRSFNAGNLTGSVTFYDGINPLGSAPISNGQAVLASITLAPGVHSITGVYSGDTTYLSSTSNALTQTVNSTNTTTTLVSSLNPSLYNQSVTLTAMVAASLGGVPAGNITFFDGTTALATVPLNAGTASLTSSGLAGGMHSITAAYGGGGDDNASTSAAVVEMVQKAGTTTLLNANSNAGTLILTATVNPGNSGAPTGVVTFLDGTTQLGSVTVNANGVATLSTAALAAGNHSITAAYSGDGDFDGSSSSTISILADFTMSALALTPSSVLPGQSATASLTITPSNGLNSSGVSLTCSVSPAPNSAPTCSVGPMSMDNGIGTAKVTVSANGSATAVVLHPASHSSALLFAFGLCIPAMLLSTPLKDAVRRRQLSCTPFFGVFLVLTACLLQACGAGSASNPGGGPKATPAGAYTITIVGHANGTQHETSATLTVQ